MTEARNPAPVLALDALTFETFMPHRNDTFTVPLADGPLPLALAQVADLGWSRQGARKAFSLLFLGPPAPLLPQRIYRLEHPAFVLEEIFLVPLGPEAGKMRYEAIFT
jgi:hypothetical protein